MLATFIMAVFARMPLAVAPSMGVVSVGVGVGAPCYNKAAMHVGVVCVLEATRGLL